MQSKSFQRKHETKPTVLGLTGFDSKMGWFVSMQRVGNSLYNLNYQTISGEENNYALAA